MKRTEISEYGEFGLIQKLTKDIRYHQDTICGVGDDSAVVKTSGLPLVMSTDLLVEGIHFDLAYTPLKHLGYKSVVVNLSDIYAMNARPKHITMSIAVSNRFSVEALEEFYEGVYLACGKYQVDLIGGDTTSSNAGFMISVTAIGEAPVNKIVYRSGAKIGDLVCVTGNLGAAYLGLQVLMREKQVYLADPNMRPALDDQNSYLIQRILKPEAQRELIDFFAEHDILPSAMMDISDGLSSELMHICSQSSVGAIIEEKYLPVDSQTYNQAMQMNLDPTTISLSGGEDYELLFTIDPKNNDVVAMNPNVTVIGEILDKNAGIKLKTRSGNQYDMISQGWVNF